MEFYKMENLLNSKHYYIDQINSSKANKMTALYHYSGVGFKKAQINLGIFRKTDNLMVGVLQWGISAQESIRLDRYVKEPITKEEYLELNRFCMADSEGKNAESEAISLGIKWIRQNRPDIKLLVSYAGRKEGNYGYIYQATNWEYLGYFVSPGFWALDGHEKHMITLWTLFSKHKESENQTFNDFLCANHSDVRQTWTKQFIYIQRLDKNLTPAGPILPYPKPANEYPIKVKEKIIKENNEIYENPKELNRSFVQYYYEKDKYLFSRRTLLRRGEIESEQRKVAMYNISGELEKVFDTISAYKDLGYTPDSIRRSVKTGKDYKTKYFRIYSSEDEIAQEIEVPFVVIIDEIPFPSLSEAARYLKVSRQAVSQAKNRQAKSVGGKDVIWGEN